MEDFLSNEIDESNDINTKDSGIKIRGLDKTVVDRLNELAEKKGKSREAYLRDILTTLAYSGELMELDYQYATLVKTLADQSHMLGEIIDRNTYALSRVEQQIGRDE